MKPYEHEPLMTQYESYSEARDAFELGELPEEYNIATDLVETHEDGSTSTALVYDDGTGNLETLTYADIDLRANRIANLLADSGLREGQRVAICLPDTPANVSTQMATYKVGAILVPLSPNYGSEDLNYRLTNSSAEFFITTSDILDTLGEDLAESDPVVVTMTPDERADIVLSRRRESFPDSFTTAETAPTDPALMIYTSGTTGDPKGVVHGHQVLLGYYPGFEMWNDRKLSGDRTFWSNNEWSFTGSLIGHLYCAWHYGATYLSKRMADRYDPIETYDTLDEYGVTNAFIRPELLKDMMETERCKGEIAQLDVIGTGGSPYGDRLVEWVESELGATPVEVYGQSEANMFVSSCPSWFPTRPDRIGKAVPGADVGVVNQYGTDVGDGNVGELALKRSHPVVFDHYWEKPEKLNSAFIDEWMLTESMCVRDEEGYYAFVARKDDIIAVGEHYVSPADIEAELNSQSGVEASGVVDGRGDTEIVAYVSVGDGWDPQAVVERLSESSLEALAPHEQPDRIEVVDRVPTTERGKIKRAELRSDA